MVRVGGGVLGVDVRWRGARLVPPGVAARACRTLLNITDRRTGGLVDQPDHRLFSAGRGLGGLVFGWLGDKIGRVRAMILSMLTYSLFMGCGYFATRAVASGAVFLHLGVGDGRPMVVGRGPGDGMLAGDGSARCWPA